MPPSDEIIRMYQTIDEKGTLELEWQCPGRRPPTPTDVGDSNPSKDETMDIE